MAVTSPYSGMTFADILKMRQQAGQPVMPMAGQPIATTASMEQQAPNFTRFMRSVTPETEVPSSVGVTGNVITEGGNGQAVWNNRYPSQPSGMPSQNPAERPDAQRTSAQVQQPTSTTNPIVAGAVGAAAKEGIKQGVNAVMGEGTKVATPELIDVAMVDKSGNVISQGAPMPWGGAPLYEGGPSTLGAVGGGLMLVGGAVGAHNQFGSGVQGSTMMEGAKGAMNGAMIGGGIGSFVPGVGTAIGAGIGAVAGGMIGLARGAFGGRTTEFELMGQGIRKGGAKIGLFNYVQGSGDEHIQLADGSIARVKDVGYMIDENREFGVQAIGWTNGLAAALTGGHGPKGEKESPLIMLTGYLTNAATSNAQTIEGVRANALSFVEKAGYTRETLEARLTQLKDSKAISPEEYSSYMYGVKTLFEGDPSTYNHATVAEFNAAKGEILNQGAQVAAQTKPPAQIDPNSQIAQTVSKAPKGGTPEQGVVQATPQIGQNITPVPRMAAQQIGAAAGTWLPPVGGRPGTPLPAASLGSTWTPPVSSTMSGIGQSMGAVSPSGIPSGFRPGSKAAGGIVDNATNKWYANAEEAMKARG